MKRYEVSETNLDQNLNCSAFEDLAQDMTNNQISAMTDLGDNFKL